MEPFGCVGVKYVDPRFRIGVFGFEAVGLAEDVLAGFGAVAVLRFDVPGAPVQLFVEEADQIAGDRQRVARRPVG